MTTDQRQGCSWAGGASYGEPRPVALTLPPTPDREDLMADFIPNLAYLLITEWDVVQHPDLPEQDKAQIMASLTVHAALYNSHAMPEWADLPTTIRHAHNTVSDSIARGWWPTDVAGPPPF